MGTKLKIAARQVISFGPPCIVMCRNPARCTFCLKIFFFENILFEAQIHVIDTCAVLEQNQLRIAAL